MAAKKKGGLAAAWKKNPSPNPAGGFTGFTPFKPQTSPPPGWYDPALDASQRASQRGLFDFMADAGTANLRQKNDYNLALEQLGLSRSRGAEDYGRQVAGLDRSYSNLATGQAQTARAAGASSGGLAQALRKRAANKAFDKAPIDTNFSRFNADLATRQAGLALSYQRQSADRNLRDVPRAQREATAFGLDTNTQRWFQSKQAGYEPPVKPSNERSVAGLTVQVQNQKGPLAKRSYLTSGGRMLNRQQFVSTVKKRRRGLAGALGG